MLDAAGHGDEGAAAGFLPVLYDERRRLGGAWMAWLAPGPSSA